MTDETPYSVRQTFADIELREYPSTILATVRGRGDAGAFGLLLRYITGANVSPAIIPMTAPVVSDEERFFFVLPPSYTMDTAPVPLDPRVELEPIPPRRMAVIRFQGWASNRKVCERTGILLRVLRHVKLEPLGNPFLMRYNPPAHRGSYGATWPESK